MSEYAKKLIKKICIIFCVSFGGMFALLCLFMSIREKESEYEALVSSDAEERTEQEDSSRETAEEEAVSDGEQLAQDWGLRISSKGKMDFHRVLLEEDYRIFEGNDVDSRLDEKFSFAYPKNLYYTVEAEADDAAGSYCISFKGKDNDALPAYSQEKHGENDDEKPLEDMYEEDMQTLTDAEALLHLDTVYVLTGFEKEGSLEVYKVVKADDENLYTMVIKTPVPEKEDARTLLSFYTEYLYRSCGFSGSTKAPRSYAKYLTGDE